MDPIFLGEDDKGRASWLAVDPGGWALFLSPAVKGEIYLRLKVRSGRIRVSEIFFEHPSAADLRSLPLGRIEAAASGPGTVDMLREQIAKKTDWSPGAPLATIRALAPKKIPREKPSSTLVPPEKAFAYEVAIRAQGDGGAEILSGRPRPGKKASKQFYEEIACLFAIYSARSRSPVKDIAVLTGVGESTLHRWLSTARQMKILAPGRRSAGR